MIIVLFMACFAFFFLTAAAGSILNWLDYRKQKVANTKVVKLDEYRRNKSQPCQLISVPQSLVDYCREQAMFKLRKNK